MSYDFSVVVDAGGDEDLELKGFEHNCTYNLAPMFQKALNNDCGIHIIDGEMLDCCENLLTKGIICMKEHFKEYEKLNPENGWGAAEGALETLVVLRGWIKKAPNAWFRIS